MTETRGALGAHAELDSSRMRNGSHALDPRFTAHVWFLIIKGGVFWPFTALCFEDPPIVSSSTDYESKTAVPPNARQVGDHGRPEDLHWPWYQNFKHRGRQERSFVTRPPRVTINESRKADNNECARQAAKGMLCGPQKLRMAKTDKSRRVESHSV